LRYNRVISTIIPKTASTVAEWLTEFSGKFDQGWAKLREGIYVQQKRSGIIPANSQLPPRPSSIPAWDSLPADQTKLYARMTEAFAASAAYSDHQAGRVTQAIRESGELDNTLIVFIQGDNESGAEGGLEGLFHEQTTITGREETMAEKMAHIDEISDPSLYNQLPAAWACATNSPFPWRKQVASQAGGVRNGMVVS
jgi:arylsulfatase A-like enzyme